MENNIKGVDRINARIISEAEQFAALEEAKAQAQAEDIMSSAQKKAHAKAEDIISKATEKAAALTESAKSSAGMRERNSMLSLKVEMMEKAFDRAYEKLTSLDDAKYVTVMSALLAETVNGFLADGQKAQVYFAKKDLLLAEKILEAAKAGYKVKAEVAKGEKTLNSEAGFVLSCGDTEINCVAGTLLDNAKTELEKPVLDILFDGN